MRDFNAVNPRDFRAQVLIEGGFKCQSCDSVWPLSHRIRQDGRWVCLYRCWRPIGVEDVAKLDAMDFRAVPKETPHPDPYTGPVADDMGVTRLTGDDANAIKPTVLLGTTDSKAIEVEGAHLEDLQAALTVDPAGPTVSVAAAADGFTATLTITTSATPVGDYDLVLNGNARWRGLIRVR